jgi:DNA-directed RNA polymerase subunit E'/Rpb7
MELFERRELTRNVHIDAKFLKRNIHSSLVAQLKMKYEGYCLPEGFINPGSITIVEHSLGRINLIKGGLDYVVKFQSDICFPHPGQVFKAPVTLRSKIGLHAERSPIKVLLPRDLHIGNSDFDSVKDGQEIEFIVKGAKFQQGDESIVILGELMKTIKTHLEDTPAEVVLPDGIFAAPVGKDTGDKKMVTVDLATTKPADAPRRKKLIKPSNESATKGETEGKA